MSGSSTTSSFQPDAETRQQVSQVDLDIEAMNWIMQIEDTARRQALTNEYRYMLMRYGSIPTVAQNAQDVRHERLVRERLSQE